MPPVFFAAWSFIKSPIGSAVCGIVGAILGILIAWAVFAHHYEAKGAAACQARVDAAVEAQKQTQTALNDVAHVAGAQAQATKQVADQQSKEAQHDVQTAVGASTPAPADVLAQWKSGSKRLSASNAAVPHAVGSGQPAPALHSTVH